MYEKLTGILVNNLDVDPSIITPESTFETLGIDSLDIAEILMDLESELGIELDIPEEKVNCLQELADYIDSKLN